MSGKTLLNGLLLSAGLSVPGLTQVAHATPAKPLSEQAQLCVALDAGGHGTVFDPTTNCGCSGGNCSCHPK